jgi:hypothetical protein
MREPPVEIYQYPQQERFELWYACRKRSCILYFDIIYWLGADDYEVLLMSYFQLYQNNTFQAFIGLNLGDKTNLETIST